MSPIGISRCGPVALAVVVLSLIVLSLCKESQEQTVAVGNCKPVSERTSEVGCWIVAHQPIGQLTADTFWHLDVYPTRSLAEAAKGSRGTVVESLGKVWLTNHRKGWVATHQGTSHRRNRSTSCCRGRRILSTIHGSDFESRHDIIPPQSRGSRGLVYFGRRNLSGDPRAQVRWTRRRRTSDCAWRAADALDRNRRRTTPRPCPHPSSGMEARHHAGPRLDAEGPVQVARAK